MSVSLCTIGHHHLQTDNLETVARQLSDIYDINVRCVKWDGEDYIELGRFTKHEERPFHELEDNSRRSEPVLYQLDVADSESEERINPFFYMSIYKEIVDISICGWPYRSSDYERCFWENEPLMDDKTSGFMRDFRLKCKAVFSKLGIDRIFCFGDSYSATGFLMENHLSMGWDEFEDYVLSGRYLDDTENLETNHWKDISMIISVSDFLSGKNPTRCQGGADIFVDDFADLN